MNDRPVSSVPNHEATVDEGFTLVAARRSSIPSTSHIVSTPLHQVFSQSNPFGLLADTELPYDGIFLSQTMRKKWEKMQALPIDQIVLSQKVTKIIDGINAKYRFKQDGRSADDDGVKRSFDHIHQDATLNAAFALMRLDIARAKEEARVKEEARAKQEANGKDEVNEAKAESPTLANSVFAPSPWAIHYKTALSSLMYDSAKALNCLALLNDNDGTIVNLEMDMIFHIQDPSIEKTRREAIVDKKKFFTNQKRCVDGEKRSIISFDSDTQILLAVCVGYKEPLGGQQLKNTIDFYLHIFNLLYEQQKQKQNEQLKKLEAEALSDEVKQITKQQILQHEIKKLTAANINIMLIPFDGVDVALEKIAAVDEAKQREWNTQNLKWLKEEYSDIKITKFSEFKKTIYYYVASYLMNTYLISKCERIINKGIFESDIKSYLAKLADGETIIFEPIPKNEVRFVPVATNNKDDDEQKDGEFDKMKSLRPSELMSLSRSDNINIPSPSPTTTSPLPASPMSSVSLTPLSSSPTFPNYASISKTPPAIRPVKEDELRDEGYYAGESGSTPPSGSRSPSASPGVSSPRNPDPVLQNFFYFINNAKGEVDFNRFTQFASTYSAVQKKTSPKREKNKPSESQPSNESKEEMPSSSRRLSFGGSKQG